MSRLALSGFWLPDNGLEMTIFHEVRKCQKYLVCLCTVQSKAVRAQKRLRRCAELLRRWEVVRKAIRAAPPPSVAGPRAPLSRRSPQQSAYLPSLEGRQLDTKHDSKGKCPRSDGESRWLVIMNKAFSLPYRFTGRVTDRNEAAQQLLSCSTPNGQKSGYSRV